MPLLSTRGASSTRGFGFLNKGLFQFSIGSNQTNANLRTLAVNAGWNQNDEVIATIGSGVYISSNSTGTPALTVDGSFPGGVQLINNGFIVGMGGAGGRASYTTDAGGYFNTERSWVSATGGGAGGLALSVSSTLSITNNGTIAGGGGGGGGGRGAWSSVYSDGWWTAYSGGGGGGGGRSSAAANSSAGTSGSNGVSGGSGTVSGAGGGGDPPRIDNSGYGYVRGGIGGSGGGWGSGGGTGGQHREGIVGSNGGAGGGGSAGGAVSGNSNITWVATGTRLGAIS